MWRLATPRGLLCLRRWPAEHPSAERLRFIHAVLAQVWAGGFTRVAVPVSTVDGATFVSHDGHLWELAPWLPGSADVQPSPTPQRLAAALRALAEFHRAAADFRHDGPRHAPAPAIAQRLSQLQALERGGLARLRRAINPDLWPELASIATCYCELVAHALPRIAAEVAAVVDLAVPWQPCLRDIWREHVLFDGDKVLGDEVSGLIDYGALRVDSVAADLSRLLGSFVADDRPRWAEGLQAYEAIRPLSAEESRLLPVCDRSAVLLGGINWITWVFEERRSFDQPEQVVRRLQNCLDRLVCLK